MICGACGGEWKTREQAERFARSMPATAEREPRAIEVEPYWYVPAYGRVD